MSGFEPLRVELLNSNEARYVKPIKFRYKQDGKERIWECVKEHDSVATVLYNEDRKKLIFVKQIRPPVVNASAEINLDTGAITLDKNVSGYTIELCAGIVDKHGLSREEIAKEEILEETGYDVPVSSLKFISSMRSNIGISGSMHSLYFCLISDKQRVSAGGGIHDEKIEVLEYDLESAKKLMFCEDHESPFPRPSSMLLALSWFFFVYLRNSESKL